MSFIPFALSLLATLLVLPLATAADTLPRSIPPSAEALDLSDTKFELVVGSSAGCAEVITHAIVGEISDGESDDVDGIITFGNITINGFECESGADDQVLKLYAQDVLDGALPGYIVDLPEDASRSLFIGGTDMTERRCGDWTDSQLQAYAFCKDVGRLLPGLAGAGFIDNSTIPADKLVDGSMWMASAPQSGDGRICLYVETSKPVEGDEEVMAGSPSPDGDVTLAQGDIEEDENSEPAIFEVANEESIELAEQEAIKEKKCFPAFVKVTLQDGSTKRMDEVKIGDRVLVAPGTFSEVFLFTHQQVSGSFDFLRLDLRSGDFLTLTAGHYIYVNGQLVPAVRVVAGDTLSLSNDTRSAIVSVAKVKATGLYNPQTVHGDIFVDGVRCATYTTAVAPSAAHALLAPVRAVFRGLAIGKVRFMKTLAV